jgi:hypothetical protein
MVNTNELNSFLNADNAKDGDIVVILNEGVLEVKKDKNERTYKVLNLLVETNGIQLIYSPNSDALKVLKLAYGHDTKAWIGKKFQVKIYPKLSFGVTKNAILPVLLEAKKL